MSVSCLEIHGQFVFLQSDYLIAILQSTVDPISVCKTMLVSTVFLV